MPTECRVHFKSLIGLGDITRAFIEQQFDDMRNLLAPDVEVQLGDLADLSTNPASELLRNLDVGVCDPDAPVTQEQIELFTIRDGALANDVVVYIVEDIDGRTSGGQQVNLLGCAQHPPGRPGVVIIQALDVVYLLAHEFGHCCTLPHVRSNRNLMFGGTTWGIDPPRLSARQRSRMRRSDFT